MGKQVPVNHDGLCNKVPGNVPTEKRRRQDGGRFPRPTPDGPRVKLYVQVDSPTLSDATHQTLANISVPSRSKQHCKCTTCYLHIGKRYTPPPASPRLSWTWADSCVDQWTSYRNNCKPPVKSTTCSSQHDGAETAA